MPLSEAGGLPSKRCFWAVSVNLLLLGQTFLAMAGGNPSVLIADDVKTHCMTPGVSPGCW